MDDEKRKEAIAMAKRRKKNFFQSFLAEAGLIMRLADETETPFVNRKRELSQILWCNSVLVHALLTRA